LAAWSERRAAARVVSAIVVALVGVAFSAPAAALAEGGANGRARPQPQPLWHAYPLNPTHSGLAATSGTRRPTSRATRPDAGTNESAGGVSPSLWVAVAGVLLAAVLTMVVLARRRRSPAPVESVQLFEAPREVVAERVQPARMVSSMGTVGAEDEALTREVVAGGTESTPKLERGNRPVLRVAAAAAEPAETAVLKRKDGIRVAQPATPRVAAVEQATLKQKRSVARTDEVARIKAKTDASSSLKEAEDRDVTKLKAKLVERPAKRPVRVEPAAKAARRGAPQPPSGARRPAPKQVQPGRCRIEWWRGYVKSEFCANTQLPDGRESTLRRSPPFRWRKSTPPPKDLPEAAEAHETLVHELIEDGWVVSGGGSDWWALELKEQAGRRSTIERPKGAT